jgi:thymidylate synthase (FAD)
MSPSDVVFLREPRVSLLAQPAFAEPAHLRVNRHGASSGAEQLAEYAGRLRHQSQDNPSQRTTRDYLSQFKDPLRAGALEHAHFSIFLEGISRSLSNELLLLAPSGLVVSEVSPRHVDDGDLAFVIPPAMLGDETLQAVWCAQMQSSVADYRALFDALLTQHAWVSDKTQRRRIARDGACSVLPHSIATQLIVTANARAWRSLIESRGHEHADLESRRLAIAARALLHSTAPSFFDDLEVYAGSDRHAAIRPHPR